MSLIEIGETPKMTWLPLLARVLPHLHAPIQIGKSPLASPVCWLQPCSLLWDEQRDETSGMEWWKHMDEKLRHLFFYILHICLNLGAWLVACHLAWCRGSWNIDPNASTSTGHVFCPQHWLKCAGGGFTEVKTNCWGILGCSHRNPSPYNMITL